MLRLLSMPIPTPAARLGPYEILTSATTVAAPPQMVIVQHWFDELKARVPTQNR